MKIVHGFTFDRVHGITSVAFQTSCKINKDAILKYYCKGASIRGRRLCGSLHDTRLANTGQHVSLRRCEHAVCRSRFVRRIRQPFLREKGLFVLGTVTVRWNDGNGVFFKIVCPIHLITCRRDGKAFLKGINFGDVTKQLTKF